MRIWRSLRLPPPRAKAWACASVYCVALLPALAGAPLRSSLPLHQRLLVDVIVAAVIGANVGCFLRPAKVDGLAIFAVRLVTVPAALLLELSAFDRLLAERHPGLSFIAGQVGASSDTMRSALILLLAFFVTLQSLLWRPIFCPSRPGPDGSPGDEIEPRFQGAARQQAADRTGRSTPADGKQRQTPSANSSGAKAGGARNGGCAAAIGRPDRPPAGAARHPPTMFTLVTCAAVVFAAGILFSAETLKRRDVASHSHPAVLGEAYTGQVSTWSGEQASLLTHPVVGVVVVVPRKKLSTTRPDALKARRPP